MIIHVWPLFLSSVFLPSVLCRLQHTTELKFKYWLQPGTQECYHELLEKGSQMHVIYEILNGHAEDRSVLAFLSNTHNGSVLAQSDTPERGHLELMLNETTEIDICMHHTYADSNPRYLSVFFHVYHLEKVITHYKELEHFDNSSVNVHAIINSIDARVMISRDMQMELEMLNQKDFFVVEETLRWINRWAIVHILIILACFSLQTYFIRRLFKSSRR